MKIHKIVLLAALAVSIFLVSKSLWTRKLLAQSQPTPYTLSAVTYSITDRSQVVQKTTIAVRSDRARSTVTTLTMPPDSDVRRNLTFPDGRYLVAIEPLKVMSSGYHTGSETAHLLGMRAFPVNCIVSKGEQVVGEDLILDRKTLRIARTDPIGSSTASMRLTQWRDPTLNCEVLRSLIERLENGQVTAGSDVVAVSLTFGEPDPNLFQISAAYEEVYPSEAERRWAQHKGIPLTTDITASWAREDKVYLGRHQRLP